MNEREEQPIEVDTPRVLKPNQNSNEIAMSISLSSNPLPEEGEDLSMNLEGKLKSLGNKKSILSELKKSRRNDSSQKKLSIQIPSMVRRRCLS